MFDSSRKTVIIHNLEKLLSGYSGNYLSEIKQHKSHKERNSVMSEFKQELYSNLFLVRTYLNEYKVIESTIC